MKVNCEELTCVHNTEGGCTKEELNLRAVYPPDADEDGTVRALLDCYAYERGEDGDSKDYYGDKDE